jgi:hypothetical protein
MVRPSVAVKLRLPMRFEARFCMDRVLFCRMSRQDDLLRN